MRIIKLDAIDSTNSYLKQLSAIEVVEDGTVVVANFQTQGRGQMGTQWRAQEAKNLTFSVFKEVSFLDIQQHHYISIAVSLAIFKALQRFQIKKLKVKWPNDILSDDKKLAGVLIENVIKQTQISGSVIGIGLNVNQTDFKELPNASSLRLVSGHIFDLNEVLQAILNQLDIYFKLLKQGQFDQLKVSYEKQLFRKNKPSTFRDAEGAMFMGYILGISESGNIQVTVEGGITKSFALKEITLLY